MAFLRGVSRATAWIAVLGAVLAPAAASGARPYAGGHYAYRVETAMPRAHYRWDDPSENYPTLHVLRTGYAFAPQAILQAGVYCSGDGLGGYRTIPLDGASWSGRMLAGPTYWPRPATVAIDSSGAFSTSGNYRYRSGGRYVYQLAGRFVTRKTLEGTLRIVDTERGTGEGICRSGTLRFTGRLRGRRPAFTGSTGRR